MQELINRVKVEVIDKIYLKDPESSELGKNIILGAVDLIEDIGFEAFTFRKLGQRINSPEASVYRYFESKHKLLLYLTSWYWGWMEYRLLFSNANIESAEDRLRIAIQLLTSEIKDDTDFAFINNAKLHRIIISESAKAYLTKEVDDENKDGVFASYKTLVGRISDIIHEINPDYRYPHMLVSTVIEGSLHQRYFAEHLPRLTDVVEGEDSVTSFYTELVFKAIS